MAYNFEIVGGNLQAVRFTLQPGQVIVGEAGSMLFIDEGISFEARMANGGAMNQDQSWWQTFKTGMSRLMTNESMFYTWFTNTMTIPRTIALAGPYMGSMVHVQLHTLPESCIIAQSGAFLCSTAGVRMNIEFSKKLSFGFFGGEGFILQRLYAEQESTGDCFLHGGGHIIRKELNNEEITLETGALFAFTRGLEYEVGFQGMSNTFLGGNAFLTKLKGTGSVWIQSMSFSALVSAIIARIPKKSKDNGGGGGGD